ncbi:transposase [Klebsiella pneumoniae]|uniref:Transposase n=1 Tax=Klebsiella pneumoniae TaxID=573 RepID=A0A377XDF9_KLEPN|nr:transposase [Klebsiella pneumoniae]
MDEKSLYAHILNLSAPWQVKSLSLDENAGSVTVTVGIAENTRLACPGCGKSCSVHDHRHRKWRHLDTCQFTLLSKPMFPALCARSMAARRCQFPELAPEAGILCCSNRSFSHG